MKPFVIPWLLFAVPVYAQWQFGCVCSTDVAFATTPNNSHKLACRAEPVGRGPQPDTVTLVVQSQDSVSAYLGIVSGLNWNWQGPILSYSGRNPGIAWGRDNCRHLVWEMADSFGVFNVFYRNIELRMVPLNVSRSGSPCGYPDVCTDSNGLVHVVWEEPVSGLSKIWYRTCQRGELVGERFQVSTGSGARCRLPAVERFNDGLSVVWEEFDSTRTHPYRIMRRRQVGGVWQNEEVLAEADQPLSRPALDFGSADEDFAVGWDRDVNGNLEVQFYGGNGGGYLTPGSSTAPVLAHLGSVWSYLFWEEDSLGRRDIYYHFYYFMSGWSRSSLRTVFSITEPVYAPNCLGALVVWTQGQTAPYKVMWGFFSYPIAVKEDPHVATNGSACSATVIRSVLSLPRAGGALLDISGRKVLNLKPGANDVRHLRPGVYFVAAGSSVRRVLILR